MTDKTRNILNVCWSIIPRIFAALGVICAVIVLVLTGEIIFFPYKWMEVLIPLVIIILSFTILIIVAWNEEQY